MDSTKLLVDLLSGFVGGLAGATAGAYLKAYSAEKGKHFATYEDLEFLLAQERIKSYEQEKGKQLATHEDIEHVRSDVQAITRDTEAIKAQISSEVWNRQTLWSQRKEVYANLLEITTKMLEVYTMLAIDHNDRGGTDASDELKRKLIGHFGELTRTRALAQIFLSEGAVHALDRYATGCTKHSDAEKIAYGLQGLEALQQELTANAKRELGISSRNRDHEEVSRLF